MWPATDVCPLANITMWHGNSPPPAGADGAGGGGESDACQCMFCPESQRGAKLDDCFCRGFKNHISCDVSKYVRVRVRYSCDVSKYVVESLK